MTGWIDELRRGEKGRSVNVKQVRVQGKVRVLYVRVV